MIREQYPNTVTNTEFREFLTVPDCSAFYSEALVTVPSNGNIFIEDIFPVANLMPEYDKLASDNQREVVVFSARVMTEMLAARLDQIPKTAAFIFPGNGSRIIQEILSESYPEIVNERPILSVNTKRTKENGIWSVSVDVPDLDDKASRCTDWVIVDDVVLSGQTAIALREAITSVTGRESDTWTLSTWLALDPKRRQKMTKTKSSSSVEGFDAVSALYTYKGGNGIPPCNSLSTLLLGDEKGQTVRDKLQSAYFPQGFDQFLQKLAYGTTE